jgi:hypothetical protein
MMDFSTPCSPCPSSSPINFVDHVTNLINIEEIWGRERTREGGGDQEREW